MKDHKITLLGLFIGLSLYLFVIIAEADLFEFFHQWIHDLEHLELDELILPVFIVLSFSCYEHVRNSRRRLAEKERQKTFLAMMKSVQHVMNNFLNQMGLFRMTAEETPDFDPKVLQLYDDVIAEATTQIQTLGKVNELNPDAIWDSVKPK